MKLNPVRNKIRTANFGVQHLGSSFMVGCVFMFVGCCCISVAAMDFLEFAEARVAPASAHRAVFLACRHFICCIWFCLLLCSDVGSDLLMSIYVGTFN